MRVYLTLRRVIVRGVQFVVDAKGKKTAVVIDLEKNPELWEDIYDRAVARQRQAEPRESLESVRSRLKPRSGRRTRG
jgi:hypothetical protein